MAVHVGNNCVVIEGNHATIYVDTKYLCKVAKKFSFFNGFGIITESYVTPLKGNKDINVLWFSDHEFRNEAFETLSKVLVNKKGLNNFL